MNDLIKNAHSAAFSDPRFSPLTIDEYQNITITVSLLSKPERIIFCTEDELLNKIIPDKDGLIIRDGNYQSVFLPVVWKEFPDKRQFLQELKLKAGLNKNYFSDTIEVFKFNSTTITQ